MRWDADKKVEMFVGFMVAAGAVTAVGSGIHAAKDPDNESLIVLAWVMGMVGVIAFTLLTMIIWGKRDVIMKWMMGYGISIVPLGFLQLVIIVNAVIEPDNAIGVAVASTISFVVICFLLCFEKLSNRSLRTIIKLQNELLDRYADNKTILLNMNAKLRERVREQDSELEDRTLKVTIGPNRRIITGGM